MTNRNPKVDAYLKRAKQWQERNGEIASDRSCLSALRRNEVGQALLHAGEEKRRLDSRIQGILWLLFFKGALLKDPDGLLVQPGENTQSGRSCDSPMLAKSCA